MQVRLKLIMYFWEIMGGQKSCRCCTTCSD
jgi:hypothetical protein